MAKFLVFNPMTSKSASLMRMEISTTKHSISCKNIIPIRHIYKIKMTRKPSATTAAMTTMKATATTTMMLSYRQKSNKSLGVVWTVVLVVIWKK